MLWDGWYAETLDMKNEPQKILSVLVEEIMHGFLMCENSET